MLLSNIDRLGTGVTHAIALAAGAVTLLAYGAMALWLAPLMTSIVAINGAVVFYFLGAQRRRALQLGRRLGESRRAMFATVVQGLGGIKLTKILANEQRQLAEFDRNMVDLRQQGLAYSTSLGRARALFQLGAAILLALYLYLGLTFWRLLAAELVTLIILFTRTVPMLMALQQHLFVLIHSVPAMQEVDHLLAATELAAEAGGTGESEWVLIDGRKLGPADRAAWRRAVAYVPQDVFLFNATVRGNLAWGLAEGDPAPTSEIERRMGEALRQAGAEFVFDLPAGIDTPVGDGGQHLSGGERQRIALARALLRRPALLILDEATSALDVDNERRIRDAIDRLHGDLTMIVIGHRLPVLENADRIVRLEQGRIAAQGSWAEVFGQAAGEGEA